MHDHKLNTVPEWFGNFSWGGGTYDFLRQKCTRVYTLPSSLLLLSKSFSSPAQCPSVAGMGPVGGKDLEKKNEASCRMGHKLHLPVSWLPPSQRWVNLVQFPSDLGIWPVKKNWIKEIWGRPVARMLHLPWSLLEWRRRSVKLIHCPSDSGIWPIRKKRIIEIWSNFVWWILHLPWSLLKSRRRTVKLTQLPSETGISPVKKND